jgi:kumamolisin
VRAALTPAELSAPMKFSVSLRMRDFPGLQARIASGARVPAAEMEANYLPLRGDYDRVAAWLAAQGFAPTMTDNAHTTVFAEGTVAEVARAFGTVFARVAAPDGEYSSAISAPSLPADLAAVVLSVNGLQPQFRLRHVGSALAPQDLVAGEVYVTPDNVASAYNIPPSATGAGQIIAVVGEAPVSASNLSAFWSAAGVSQTTGNVTTIEVDGGPSGPTASLADEASLDVEWAGAMAPGAAIRYYIADNVFSCFTQVANDVAVYPAMTVMSVSFGDVESDQGAGVLQAFSQTFAQLAAAGVTVVASSGDSGSNPTAGTGAGGYSASAPLGVNYPASDPSVTGVGGTTVDFTGAWSYSGEVVWNQIASDASATGGGISGTFAKPAWQTGGAVLASQTFRCVPDVAAISDANLQDVILGGGFQPETASNVGVLIYDGNGSPDARAGTSLSCPVWAAVAALINQARAAAGSGPIGLMNPHLYPLQATSALNDITSGTNGAYAAGPGYDLCTGLGSPNVANLIALLSGATTPTHRLVNVSTRGEVQTGSNIVIAGFVISGAGSAKSILVRAVGPALTPLGVTGALAQPVLSVFDGSSVLIASDTGWANAPVAGTSAVAASFRQATAADMSSAGAFALPAGSADSAMVLTLPAGNYTAEVSGAGSTQGVALAEVYELETDVPQVLTNISARCFVGTGSSVEISGFVIGGNQPAQLLLRGVGPALAELGLTGVLEEPTIYLFDSENTLIVRDTGWGNALVPGTSTADATYRLATAADMSSVGAFALTPGSADSAFVVTLPPGQYSAQISGNDGTTGIGLEEIYELSGP